MDELPIIDAEFEVITGPLPAEPRQRRPLWALLVIPNWRPINYLGLFWLLAIAGAVMTQLRLL